MASRNPDPMRAPLPPSACTPETSRAASPAILDTTTSSMRVIPRPESVGGVRFCSDMM